MAALHPNAGVIYGGKEMCRTEILSNDPEPHTVWCSTYPYYYYETPYFRENTNFGTYVEPTEEMVKELEEEIAKLEKELDYKRRLLTYLLGLPQWKSI